MGLAARSFQPNPAAPAPRIPRPAPRATVPGSWSLAEVERSWKSAGTSPPARRGRWQHAPRAPLTNYPIATKRANELEAMVLARERNVSDHAQGPNGLPDTNVNVRWTARRKIAVVRAVRSGQITAEELAILYGISAEELEAWSDYADRGLRGLQQKEWATRRRKSSGGDRRSRLVPGPAPYPASS